MTTLIHQKALLLGLAAMTLTACGPTMAPASLSSPSTLQAAAGAMPEVQAAAKAIKQALKLEGLSTSTLVVSTRKTGPAYQYVAITPVKGHATAKHIQAGTCTLTTKKVNQLITFSFNPQPADSHDATSAHSAIRTYLEREHDTKVETLMISTQPVGHAKYGFLAIGKQADSPKLNWIHAGTYAVTSKRVESAVNIGANLTYH